ncbi:AglZ/HisF2 family acetamidino modification protein [Pseudohongiella sp.]|uniref:imidazole glycerol-phosphate synthase n=1 Tax=marine sediment metagenome TaxID=412755 RepID=A0A0F9W6B8_9ZZZZ|nr:AglZ/HisF2 family acetamidino modification protein [Pseudohongiella sp.]HDZ08453.1 glycosyl amidation-associated protein WbuZ [Pseudohongiella sp.]
MLRTRVIPVLLLRNENLVKTLRFGKFKYVGDPANTVRIFNELEVDELLFLDITASREQRSPNLKVLAEMANECFMPLGYGGGVRSLADAKSVFDIGFEKISVNSGAIENPTLITEIARQYGSQAVIASIDVKSGFLGKFSLRTDAGRRKIRRDPVEWAKEVEERGAGEILLTSIDREGTWQGFDLDLVRRVTDAVSIPVIAHGGAGTIAHVREVVKEAHASAVALGSMVVFQRKGMGVLVSFPDRKKLEEALQ